MTAPVTAGVGLAVVGCGAIGRIRARLAREHPAVTWLGVCDVDTGLAAAIAADVNADFVTADHAELVARPEVNAVVVATDENAHVDPVLAAAGRGHRLFIEKPLATDPVDSERVLHALTDGGVDAVVGYNPKRSYVKRSLRDGTLGSPVSALVSRHITRKLGDKIGARIKLSPAAMEATHDIDFTLWCLEPARPVRVYAQAVERVMKPRHGVADCMSIMITMDDGVVVTIGAGWILPPGYPNFSSTWIEFLGTDGALMIDDSHRDVVLSTLRDGSVFPLSTMPGEAVDHVYAGPMERETLHFLEAVALGRDALVTPEQARQVMEVYLAADLSAERDEAVGLPLDRARAEEALALSVRR